MACEDYADCCSGHCYHCAPSLVSDLRAEVTRLTAALAEAQKDCVEAAGELLVEVPRPGSEAAKMLTANSLMRRERDAALAEVAELRKERGDGKFFLMEERVVAAEARAKDAEERLEAVLDSLTMLAFHWGTAVPAVSETVRNIIAAARRTK